jgi:hypothetical protein
MSNRTISIIFCVLCWLLFTLSVYIVAPVFIFYSIVNITLAHIIYHGQDKA